MMAWSDGERIHVIPGMRSGMDDYGRLLRNYRWRVDKGYLIDMGPCTTAREECCCREYEADRYWEQDRHLEALNEMLRAARFVLPDDEPVFEDVQWLDPEETPYWHPNIKELMRLMCRCRDYCRRDPRLLPLLESDLLYRDYRNYLLSLGRWINN